jgi:hypothetical protein
MKVIMPEKKQFKLKLGDILHTGFGDIYIASKFTDQTFAWFNNKGYCANGVYNSLEDLERASQKYFTDPEYTIYSSDDYDLQLVPKGVK